MKKYENPMLQIVSIKKNDIIATSGERTMNIYGSGTMVGGQLAPDRFNEWDEGY